MKKYYNIRELLDMIETPHYFPATQIYLDNQPLFDRADGSTHNHQAWEGGYMGHMRDIMNLAILHYKTMDDLRHLDFSLSDALLCLWLHDIEKPWKYGKDADALAELEKYDDYQEFQTAKFNEYGFKLTNIHLNAIKYAHGEGDDFQKMKRVSTPLAAFVHCIDTMSARIWHGFPREEKW